MTTDHTAAPRTTDTAPAGAAADPRRWRLLVFVALAQFMVLLDTTVVNLALPAIQADLKAGATAVEWVLTAYILCFGGLMLLGGRTADRWGRRRTFLLGALLFTAASLLCGLAQGAGLLIAARALQGCSAPPSLSPAAMSLVTTTTFPKGRERTTALAVWAALAGLGGTLGVIAGGLDHRQPQLALDLLHQPALRDRRRRRRPAAVRGRPETRIRGSRPDIAGAVTVTAGLAALVYAIVNIQDHGAASTPYVLAPAAASLGLLAAARS